MGYYTKYDLSVVDENKDLIQKLREQNEYAEEAIDADGNSNELTKWYDHEEDLRAFSLQAPNTLFILDGRGEDDHDIWRLYVLNGKAERVLGVITYPEFKPENLK